MNNKKIFSGSLLYRIISFFLLTSASFNYPNNIPSVSFNSTISRPYNFPITQHNHTTISSLQNPSINITNQVFDNFHVISTCLHSHKFYLELKNSAEISNNILFNNKFHTLHSCNTHRNTEVTVNGHQISTFISLVQQKTLSFFLSTYYKATFDNLALSHSDIKKFFLGFSKQLYKFFYKRKFMASYATNFKTFTCNNKKILTSLFKLVQNNPTSVKTTISAIKHLNLSHSFLSYNYFKVIL
ncbi:hypothetical protein EDL79_04835 [Ehrlichia ruminantium]|uniref:Uncharacterized protein n=1 Tax=Ehrlichia ruminantium TaxID=779 RepID=A0AAE6QBP6_EHRRU|nr:hypothetical protein [Ehrlichia ruminantium]QGR02924.1 hypothetical protein EDL81_04820 [Ehrlichia ruminantium]QGR03848.1 hypothetical protein EDL80_04825 [Ehrlichia ruminantium]QGR04775.1 hypothetical protein EDL79_04835 [Ehrlichia ruminantium]